MSKDTVENSDRQFQIDAIRTRLKLKVRCGSCMFLRGKAQGFDAPCMQLGKNESSVACNHFEPNYVDGRDDADDFREVARIVRNMPPKSRGLLAYALNNSFELEAASQSIREVTLRFGQPVAINLGYQEADYVNCYFSGFVFGISQDKKHLFIYSHVNRHGWVSLMMLSDSNGILTTDQWDDHKQELIKQDRINAPKEDLNQLLLEVEVPKVEKDDYAPRPMASAPIELRQHADKSFAAGPSNAYTSTETAYGKKLILNN